MWIRFFHGLLDGAIPLGKTILSEITNEKNIAFGTSQFFVGSSVGGSELIASLNSRLVGPILCGYLSNPDNIAPLIRVAPIFGKVI